MSDLRPSIRATYDSRETGSAYWVTVTVNGQPEVFREPIPDPFARTTVRVVRWRDLLRGLLRRRLEVEVTIGASAERMDDVLELDDQALVPGRTRQAAFRQSMHEKLRAAVSEEEL